VELGHRTTEPEAGERAPWAVQSHPRDQHPCHELDIPSDIQKHRTFPVSLLHATADDPIPGQVIPLPLPLIVEGEEEWEMQEVLDSRRIQGRL